MHATNIAVVSHVLQFSSRTFSMSSILRQASTEMLHKVHESLLHTFISNQKHESGKTLGMRLHLFKWQCTYTELTLYFVLCTLYFVLCTMIFLIYRFCLSIVSLTYMMDLEGMTLCTWWVYIFTILGIISYTSSSQYVALYNFTQTHQCDGLVSTT